MQGTRTESRGEAIRLDAVVFGGGVAGLWLLDELVRSGVSAVLLEAGRLGQGQTVAAQGIIHGGLKYTLKGLLNASASNIREMPGLWRDCLDGKREPNLSEVVMRSDVCHLWRTKSLHSRLGMIGARFGLRVAPQRIAHEDRPDVLANCPGDVFELAEPVLEPRSMVASLANRHRERILYFERDQDELLETTGPGEVTTVNLRDPSTGERCRLEPRHVVFTAGAGNARLRLQAGFERDEMQRRPLQIVMVRGDLPWLNGHCVDGAKTRVTVTSSRESTDQVVWQVGGQVSEDGAGQDKIELLRHARAELEAVLPGLDLSGAEWASYRVDRAERSVSSGQRPDDVQLLFEGNTCTAWPTKLALAPKLAERVLDRIEPSVTPTAESLASLSGWTRPEVALPPWATCTEWHRLDGTGDVAGKRVA